jgi:hypothetical protein
MPAGTEFAFTVYQCVPISIMLGFAVYRSSTSHHLGDQDLTSPSQL